ncbi:MAG: Cof-type HAD-IIB family hydrolase [Bacilli bacterium]
MKYLILIDIDGTLENDKNVVSPKTIKAIEKITNQGHIVVLASGRARCSVIKVKNQIHSSNYIITSNGAEIYNTFNNLIVYGSYLPIKELLQICNYASKLKIKIKIAKGNYEYINYPKENNYQTIINDFKTIINQNIKQVMFISQNNKLKKLKSYIKKMSNIKIIRESTYNQTPWFSIVNQGASKGNMLKILADKLNIPIKNTIAIGNDYNDLSMINSANDSYAMANANNIVKTHAKYITYSNNDDGVAIALEKIMQEKNID